jgi:hypothetical protein
MSVRSVAGPIERLEVKWTESGYDGSMTTRDEANRKVAVEMVRFRQALPSLLAGPHAGEWVVFLDGTVKFAHHDRAVAYHWALEELGALAGFVLAQVAPERVARIGGAHRRVSAPEHS